jgi:hypothetical protein
MGSNLMEDFVIAHKAYIKARKRAEKTRDPKTVKKIRIAERNLEKAEDEANKTMDPKLKKSADQLLKRMWEIHRRL